MMFKFKKKYRVLSASPVDQREVTNGFKHRTFRGQTTVNIKGRLFQYSQQLIVKRKDEVKSIKIFTKLKKKVIGKGSNKIIQMILKPKHKGDHIWI